MENGRDTSKDGGKNYWRRIGAAWILAALSVVLFSLVNQVTSSTLLRRPLPQPLARQPHPVDMGRGAEER